MRKIFAGGILYSARCFFMLVFLVLLHRKTVARKNPEYSFFNLRGKNKKMQSLFKFAFIAVVFLFI